jgi:(1->4)-alpha-D-glucan 1-alpha-D-glucosylmutase
MRIPLATYRLQFSPSFGFQKASRILPYLLDLGISDIYASPIFKAKQGSSHGYDIVDHNRLDTELGTQEELVTLFQEVSDRRMGWLQDVVPNHMSYSHENGMLADILELGEHSKFFDFFDIEWNHSCHELKGKILAPFLNEFYVDVLRKGDIKLEFGKNGFIVSCPGIALPLR